MHTFYQLGKKYVFSPHFLTLFQFFFPPNMLFGHIFAHLGGGGDQTEEYPVFFGFRRTVGFWFLVFPVLDL